MLCSVADDNLVGICKLVFKVFLQTDVELVETFAHVSALKRAKLLVEPLFEFLVVFDVSRS